MALLVVRQKLLGGSPLRLVQALVSHWVKLLLAFSRRARRICLGLTPISLDHRRQFLALWLALYLSFCDLGALISPLHYFRSLISALFWRSRWICLLVMALNLRMTHWLFAPSWIVEFCLKTEFSADLAWLNCLQPDEIIIFFFSDDSLFRALFFLYEPWALPEALMLYSF